MTVPRAWLSSAVLALLAMLGLAAPAASQEDSVEPVKLDYSGHAGCPPVAEFLRELGARTDLLRPARADEPARRFEVAIEERGGRSVGRLSVTMQGAPVVREVTAPTCSEVVSALALIAALALDPRSQDEPSKTPAAPSSTPSVASAAPTPPPVAPRLPPVEPFESVLIPDRLAVAAEEEERLSWSIGIGAEVLSGVAPDPTAAARVFGAFAFPARSVGGVFAPELRMSVVRSANTRGVAPDLREAKFAWTSARLELCPARVSIRDDITLRPCAGLSAGALQAAGERGVEAAQSQRRPWLSADVLGRIAWRVAGTFLVEIHGGALIPIVRDEFFFVGPTTTVHEIPPVAGYFGAGAGAQFP